MQLYERIRLLAQDRGISQAKLAEIVGVYPQKFSQWLNEKSQKNLWEHLPKILDAFPDIRPEWLYYDHGPMLRDAADTQPDPDLEQQLVEARAKIAALEAELREADRLNRKLTARLLVDGVGDNADATATGKASEGHG
ncbi:helix-turn-helix domain-containing protein [Desulfovibrio sp.]|uniref:helix-turn-helix domain-containing protein n=1 Tax=Desulfovibrio sp. TaxID=885 RepID=UPI003AB915EE